MSTVALVSHPTETDDHAFALHLCNEVHRLYDGYQSGELTPPAELAGALKLCLRALATVRPMLEGTIVLRTDVAMSQAREMLSILSGKSTPLPAAPRALVAASTPAGGADVFPGGLEVVDAPSSVLHPGSGYDAEVRPATTGRTPAVYPPDAQPCAEAVTTVGPSDTSRWLRAPNGEAGQQDGVGSTVASPSLDGADSTAASPSQDDAVGLEGRDPSLTTRAIARFRAQTPAAKALWVMLACIGTAVAIDLPLTVLALFPGQFTVILSCCAGGLVGYKLSRLVHRRRA